MEPLTKLQSREIAEDTVALSVWLPVAGFGVLPVNAFVIRAAEPVLIDTGLALAREEFLAALRETIDPQALKWIWLTHVDPDHVGNLAALLAEAPRARVVTSFLGMAKLDMSQLPVAQAYLLNPGQRLDVGDRQLVAVHPPVFDAPETTGALDSKTGALFSADCFGALLPQIADAAADVPDELLRAGMVGWATVDAPWLAQVAPERFDAGLEAIRRLEPAAIFSSHAPPAFGMTDTLLQHLAGAPAAPPFVGPDQAALERMMALT